MARSLGIGGGLGLGSIVYGLAVIAALLDDDSVLDDAHAAAELITEDIIAADAISTSSVEAQARSSVCFDCIARGSTRTRSNSPKNAGEG